MAVGVELAQRVGQPEHHGADTGQVGSAAPGLVHPDPPREPGGLPAEVIEQVVPESMEPAAAAAVLHDEERPVGGGHMGSTVSVSSSWKTVSPVASMRRR